MIKFVLAAGAALALMPTAGHATSSPVLVSYANLDLTSAEGQAQLDRRIATAARRICSLGSDRSTREMSDYRKCRDTAMQGARKDADLAIAKSLAERENLAAR